MTESASVGDRLLSAITTRDYEAIAGCFADDARFDVLTPHQLRRHATAAEAADRYRYWLGRLDDFEVLEHDAVPIADRLRIRYRFRGRDPEAGWELNEHTGYAEVEEGHIVSMTLTCAGFRPTKAP